ncbi:hypothetical protein BKE38_04995 [Pseudoroseomonas deserti]|uniref:Beta-lactamase-related domain-containing protein n=1 Tax=Teichococcus deserti TaxID=1817963 RepID=A0A1V2H8H4_9PROT|nr:serine hydrolase domain-containing protein [Pseudoroseomonas deserti]ONG57054.1 hypothetical protein BKE38_04995 [Pseudoroseomonas deserti]
MARPLPGSARRRTLGALAGTGLLAACGAASPRLRLGDSPPEDVPPLVPDALERALAALPEDVEAIRGPAGVPGVAVAVVAGGQRRFARGFGRRRIDQAAPVTTETVFQIASLSKPLAASVVATQVAAGRCAWDDPAQRHLPWLRLSDPGIAARASIGDFMAHRTGLPAYAGDQLEDLGFGRRAILERLRLLPLRPFRASYAYSNFGLTLGAEAAAAAAGQDWESLAESALYRPLGMGATSSRHADFLARADRAVLHARTPEGFRPLYDRDADAQSPAGGVSSNVLDLAAWMTMLLAGGAPLVPAEALAPAFQPQALSAPGHVPGARPGFYGFGFNVGVGPGGRVMLGHSGAFLLGGATAMQLLPGEGIGIVVLTNAAPVGVAEAIAATFLDRLQFGAPQRDWAATFGEAFAAFFAPEGDLAGKTPPVPATAPRAPEACLGRYDNAFHGPAEVVRGPSGLLLRLGPKAVDMPLLPWDGDDFAMAPGGENAPPGSLASLRFDMAGGRAVGFRAQYYDASGLGRWTR